MEEKILRYLNLLKRRGYIKLHSGVSWIPEYRPELEQIDNELMQLRDELGMEQIKKPSRREAIEDFCN